MGLDVLRAELERLFELDQLTKLSEELLGHDAPSEAGTAKLLPPNYSGHIRVHRRK